MVLEQKIGFDKVREKISAKCATQYAVRKVAAEQISRDGAEIIDGGCPPGTEKTDFHERLWNH